MNKESLDAARFAELLNIYDAAVQREGRYAGQRVIVNQEMLEQHLRGELTLGFCVAAEGFANKIATARFAGLDLDKNFDERFPILKTVLEGMRLGESSFTTNGSEPGRGKIIIALSDGIDRNKVAELLKVVLAEANRLAPDIIPVSPSNGDIELFPRVPKSRTDSSGLLRIAGRNVGKNGPIEELKMLSGEPLELRSVKKCSGYKIWSILRSHHGKLVLGRPKRILDAILNGLFWGQFPNGSRGVFTWLINSAIYCRKRYYDDPVRAHAEYRKIVERVADRSPNLNDPSPRNGDKRNPLLREFDQERAWENAQRLPIWQPNACPRAREAARRVYFALVHISASRQLPEHCFSVDQGTICNVLGVHKYAVQKALKKAQEDGLIVVLHPGKPRVNGSHVFPAMYGLVGAGESPETVWRIAREMQTLKRRYIAAPIADIDSPSLIAQPTAKFWNDLRTKQTGKTDEHPALREARHIVMLHKSTIASAVTTAGGLV